MSLALNSHFQARTAVAFCGFFAGGAGFALLTLHRPDSLMMLAPVMAFGGAFLAQLVFAYVVPAICPSCGAASARPMGISLFNYACSACGAEADSRQAVIAVEVAAAADPVQREKKGSRFALIFVAAGLVCIGLAIFSGADSIQLLVQGVSTQARVLSVSHVFKTPSRLKSRPRQPLFASERDSDRRPESQRPHWLHTALVEYEVDGKARTLQRDWTTEPGAFFEVVVWKWPDYQQGEELRVIYLPSDPYRASIYSIGELFLMPLFLLAAGLVFTAFGVAVARRTRSGGAPETKN